jgi:hypothetical protein
MGKDWENFLIGLELKVTEKKSFPKIAGKSMDRKTCD